MAVLSVLISGIIINRSEELKKFHEEFVEEGQHLSRTTQTFSQVVYGHIKRKGYNKVVFIEKTLLSGKTYDRIKNNELNNPTLETVVAICIGLELSPTYSEEILRLAGYTLNNTPQQLAYKKLIHSYRGHSIYGFMSIWIYVNIVDTKTQIFMQFFLKHLQAVEESYNRYCYEAFFCCTRILYIQI